MRRILGAILAVALLACAGYHPGLYLPNALTPISQPPNAQSAWEYDWKCAGMPGPVPALDSIHWYTTTHMMLNDKYRVFGYYDKPLLITLDSGMVTNDWLVRHELMHHLARLYANGESGHPVALFAKCDLEAYQHGL